MRATMTGHGGRCAPHLAAVVGLAVLLLPCLGSAQKTEGAASLDEVQAELSEAFDAIGRYSAQERDEAIAALDRTLVRIDAEIERVERRVRNEWSEMSQAARADAAGALRTLRSQRNRLSEARGALAHGVGAAWDDLVDGVRNGWTALESAWDQAARTLGPEPRTGE
jgi:hypothetical protein